MVSRVELVSTELGVLEVNVFCGCVTVLTHVLTVSHQKSKIFLPPIPGSRAFGTPARWRYNPVSSFWNRGSREGMIGGGQGAGGGAGVNE